MEEKWCLLGKRYKPSGGKPYHISGDSKSWIICFDKKKMTEEEVQKALDIFHNGDAYSAHTIEHGLYDALQKDFNEVFHLAMRNKLSNNQILECWIKSINNKFDKDKDFVI